MTDHETKKGVWGRHPEPESAPTSAQISNCGMARIYPPEAKKTGLIKKKAFRSRQWGKYGHRAEVGGPGDVRHRRATLILNRGVYRSESTDTGVAKERGALLGAKHES